MECANKRHVEAARIFFDIVSSFSIIPSKTAGIILECRHLLLENCNEPKIDQTIHISDFEFLVWAFKDVIIDQRFLVHGLTRDQLTPE